VEKLVHHRLDVEPADQRLRSLRMTPKIMRLARCHRPLAAGSHCSQLVDIWIHPQGASSVLIGWSSLQLQQGGPFDQHGEQFIGP